MSLKDQINKIAKSAALAAVNYTSTSIQGQIQQQQNLTGLMQINQVNGTSITVTDPTGNIQIVTYVGSDYLYPGQFIFVSNGYAS